MASGRQLAEQNAQTFVSWVASKTDDDYRAMAYRGILSRKEIAKECGFAKSALDQNPRIKSALRELEEDLRRCGILPPLVKASDESPKPAMREPSRLRAAQDAERLRRLEQENAALKAENAEIKRMLARDTLLKEALALTGRLPR